MKIKFKNIGKGHWRGEISKPDTNDQKIICDYAVTEALKHLPAKIPELSYDADKMYGEFFLDGKNVGNFWVVK